MEWSLVFPLTIGIILGTIVGLDMHASLSNENLKWVITIFLISVGAEMIIGFTQTLAKKEKKLISLTKLMTPAHGSWIGFLSSIIGIGGGSFTTPLMIAGGYNIRKGIGTAAACGVPIAIAGGFRIYVIWTRKLRSSQLYIWVCFLACGCSHFICQHSDRQGWSKLESFFVGSNTKKNVWYIFNHGWCHGNDQLIVELSEFFNNPSLIDFGFIKIQYYAVTWVLSAVLIFQYLKTHPIILGVRLK